MRRVQVLTLGNVVVSLWLPHVVERPLSPSRRKLGKRKKPKRQGFYYNTYAGVALPNPSSIRLHEAMGFQPVWIYRGVGYKAGAWRDVAWFELLLQPRVPYPKPPTNINVVRQTLEWESALTSGVPLLTP